MKRVHRRNIILGVGAFLGGAAAQGIVGNEAHRLIHAVLDGPVGDSYERITNLFPRETKFADRYPRDLRAAKALFGDKGDILKLVGGRAHHQYPNAMHPDDKWACETVVEYANQMAQQHLYDPNFSGTLEAGSFMCAGSPVSNAWARTFLEYNYVDRTRPNLGLKRYEGATVRLPFEFVLDRETINRVAKLTVHRTEKGRSVPNWSIRTRSGNVLTPNTKDRERDFLVISRIPNWKERRRPRFGHFKNTVTILGGTHGVGTSAVRLLLADNDLLGKILLTSAKFEYWQVLMTIDSMEVGEHPYTKTKRLIAKSINRVFECEPVYV